jgi:pre-mRNA-splicing factor ATP-dependent RNA helicase DHX38/PRP16
VCNLPIRLTEGITAHQVKKVEHPRGLDDFKRRSNRDRDRFHRRDEHPPRGWEVTPRSERGSLRDDAPSLRVPNVKWDATPRGRREGDGSGGGWGTTGSRGWDAPTPRASRGSSPDEGGNVELDMREWEEEQVRLDRDWYMGAEEGGLMGDEEHNPLAQYDDLTAAKQAAEVTKRLPVCSTFSHKFQRWFADYAYHVHRKYPPNKLNMYAFCNFLFFRMRLIFFFFFCA